MLKVVFMRGVAIRSAVTAGTQMDSMTEAPKPAACTRPRKPVLSRLIGKTSRPGLGGSCSHTCPWRGQLIHRPGESCSEGCSWARSRLRGGAGDNPSCKPANHRVAFGFGVASQGRRRQEALGVCRRVESPSPRVVLLGGGEHSRRSD
jgi:hypothetical protein